MGSKETNSQALTTDLVVLGSGPGGSMLQLIVLLI